MNSRSLIHQVWVTWGHLGLSASGGGAAPELLLLGNILAGLHADPSLIHPLPVVGIIMAILILRPLKRGELFIMGLHYTAEPEDSQHSASRRILSMKRIRALVYYCAMEEICTTPIYLNLFPNNIRPPSPNVNYLFPR